MAEDEEALWEGPVEVDGVEVVDAGSCDFLLW